jgi:hypothetical protein
MFAGTGTPQQPTTGAVCTKTRVGKIPAHALDACEADMAIYHLSAKPVKRSTGRSATAAAAYRSGSEIADQRTGETFDYRRKGGVEHTEIVLPDYAARHDINWPRDRAALWNAAELAERRKDSRVAREYEVALPAELDAAQRRELVREFAQHIADRHGCAVDIAIHAPSRGGDPRNHHAHLLATTRRITPTGLGDKTTVELSDTDRKKRGLGPASTEIEAIRAHWAELSNRALARHGHAERVDHRSLAAQREEAKGRGEEERAAELDREPTKHLGPSATAMERRGETTDLGDINRRIAEAAEAGRLEREREKLDGSILDLSGDLAAALKDRDAARALQRDASPDGALALDARREAREAWAALRTAGQQARQAHRAHQAHQAPQSNHEHQDRGPQVQPGRGAGRPPIKERGRDPNAPFPGSGAGAQSKPAGLRVDRSLLDRVQALGGRAADPQDLERLLREWMLHEQREREQRDPSGRDPAARDPDRGQAAGPPDGRTQDGRTPDGRTPGDRTQAERDRDDDHRRHRDQGLDR